MTYYRTLQNVSGALTRQGSTRLRELVSFVVICEGAVGATRLRELVSIC